MDLQLCEERRQMGDVEREVKKRLVEFAPTLKPTAPHQREPPPSKRTVVVAVKASEAAAARAVFSSTSQEMKPDKKNKLIKYSDRFRRN